jgi:hypothetical protein
MAADGADAKATSPLSGNWDESISSALWRSATVRPAHIQDRDVGRRRPTRIPGHAIVTRKIGGDAQKVRRRSRPTPAFRHESPNANCHGVRLDDALDRGFAVCIIDVRKGAGGHSAHRAKSAIRGRLGRRTPGNACKPRAAASSRAPRMRGRALSNSRHSSVSERRCCSPIGANVRKTPRSAKSARLMMSSMPFTSSGRAA